MQFPPVSALMFAATALIVASAALAWDQREVPGGTSFVAFLGCAAVWAVTYGVQLLFTDIDRQLLLTNFQYPAGLFTCLAFGAFAVNYTGRDHYLTRGRLAALVALPVVTSVVIWIPSLEWLVRRESAMVRVGSFLIADINTGPLFALAVAYCYLIVIAGLCLLGLTAVRTRALYQKQAALITLTAFVPLIGGGFAYVFDTTVIDYTPVGLAVFGVGAAVALTRYRLLDVSPVPRNRVIDQVDTGIVVTDASDRVVDINPAAARLVGERDVLGRRLGTVDATAAEMASMETGTTRELRLGDAEAEYFECTKSSLASEGSLDDTHLYILTDVTERRERRQALEEKNDRLDSFAEVLSHDLRNPLSVAAGSTELAREEADPAHFDRIEAAHERMDEIIDTMLTLARSGQQVTDADLVDVETVALDAWAHVATGDASLTVEGTREVVADTTRLTQLFENLFRNSVEHGSTGDGDSEVTVRVGTTDAGFFVADDGPGIPEDEREEIFSPGVSSSADGTGVGLSIVRAVVDGHDWSIRVTESEAGGARFDIEV